MMRFKGWALVALLLPSATGTALTDALERDFLCPPDTARPYVWWTWTGNNVTEEGIIRDFRVMRECGIGGACIFMQGYDFTNGAVNAKMHWQNDEWWRMLEVSAREAERNGITLGMHNCPGFTVSGGPWITPELSMKKVVASVRPVRGGGRAILDLPPPKECENAWHEEIAVLAVPEAPSVSADSILDLTGKTEVVLPVGDWVLYRFCAVSTGAAPEPLPHELKGTALEVDKFSREAVKVHLDNILPPLKAHIGRYFGKSFKFILMDSYEARSQNWTHELPAAFKSRFGYAVTPYLPALVGATNIAGVAKFTKDLAQLHRELSTENHYRQFAERIHDEGLEFHLEPYGNDGGIIDWTSATSICDVPMVEFWSVSPRPPRPDDLGRITDGRVPERAWATRKHIIGAEAFTAFPTGADFRQAPRHFKRCGDAVFAKGINRLYLNGWTHQPLCERFVPGFGEAHWGPHFGSNQPWIIPARAWFFYLSRCQALLQRGEPEEELVGVPENMRDVLRTCGRHEGDAKWFFVANIATAGVARTELAFPISGMRPELWNPDTGAVVQETTWAAKGGKTIVEVELPAAVSVFVVFRSRTESTSGNAPVSAPLVPVQTLQGPWKVSFEGLAAPKPRTFSQLCDWSSSDDNALRYFSGIAVYETTFEALGDETMLDLGDVREVAEVSINGGEWIGLWHEPFCLDVAGLLRPGRNGLHVKVANTWHNRLVGDEQMPEDCVWSEPRYCAAFRVAPGANRFIGRSLLALPDFILSGSARRSGRVAFFTHNYVLPDSPLIPAGLHGPVVLSRRSLR